MLKGWQGDVSTETSSMQKGSGMSLLGSCSPEVPQTPCHYPALKNEHSVALTGLLETRSRVDWDALLSSLGLPNRKL